MVKTAATGKQVIYPKSFHFIKQTPISLMNFLLAIPNGLNNAAAIIFSVFMVGGTFRVIQDTKARDLGIHESVKKFGDKALLLIPILRYPYLFRYGI